MGRKSRIALWVVLVLVAAPVLLAAALYAALQTQAGRDFILARVLRRMEPALRGYHISGENLGGNLPGEVRIGRIIVSDDLGPWLYINNITMDWRPAGILRKRHYVDSFRADSALVARVPVRTKTNKPLAIPKLPQRLPNLVVDQFMVSQVVLADTIYPGSMTLRAQGAVASQSAPPLLVVDADAASIEGPPLEATANVNLQPQTLGVDVRYAEPVGGLAGHLMRLDPPEPIRLAVQGQGPTSHWEGTALAYVGDYEAMNMNLVLESARQIGFRAEGFLVPPATLIPDSVEPAILGRNDIVAAGTLSEQQVLTLEQFDWRAPHAELRLTGPADLVRQTVDMGYTLALPELREIRPATTDLAGSAKLTGRIAGLVSQPEVSITLAARDLEFRGTAGQLDAAANIKALEPVAREMATLAVVGEGQFTGLHYARAPDLPHETLAFHFDIGTAPPDVVTVNQLTITNPEAALAASGVIGLDTRSINARVTAQADQIAYLTGLFGSGIGGSGRLDADIAATLAAAVPQHQVSGSFSGSFTSLTGLQPTAKALLGGAADFSGKLNMTGPDTVQLTDFHLASDNASGSGGGTYNFSTRRVDATANTTIPALANLEPVVKRPLSGSGDATFQVQGPKEQLSYVITATGRNMVSGDTAGNLTASAQGVVNATAKTGTANVAVHIPQVAPFLPPKASIRGAASVKADTKFDLRDNNFSGAFTGRLSDVRGLPAAAQALTGDAVDVSGSAVYENRQVSLRDLNLTTVNAVVKASGVYSFETKHLQAQSDISLPRLEVLSEPLRRDIAGSMSISASAEGVAPNVQLALEATSDGLALGGQQVQVTAARAEVGKLFDEPSGNVRLQARWRDETLNASTQFTKRESVLTLADLSVTGPKTTITGDVAVDLNKRLATGTLSANAGNLEWLASIANLELAGAATANVRLHAEEGSQNAVVDASARDLVTPWGAVATANVNADLTNVLKAIAGRAEFTATRVNRGKLTLNTAKATAEGEAGNIAFAADAAGTAEDRPLKLSSGGRWKQAEDGYDVALQTLRLDWGDLPVSLEQPLTVQKRGARYEVSPFVLTVQNGNVRGSGTLSEEAVSFNGEFSDLPLALAALFGAPEAEGAASGNWSLTGAPQSPAIAYTLSLRNIVRPGSTQEDLPPVDVQASGTLQSGRLSTDFQVERLLREPVRGQVVLPVSLSLSPFRFSAPRDQPISGNVAYNGRLETLDQLLLLDQQRLEGNFNGQLQFAGTIAAPEVTGTTVIDDATVENYSTGTVLKRLHAELTANGRRVDIANATATDGGDGTFVAEGWLDINPAADYPLQLALTMKQATVVRRDYAVAELNGVVRFNGSYREVTVTSENLVFGPATFTIPEEQAPGLEGLNVVETNLPEGRQPLQPPPAKGATPGAAQPPPAFAERFVLNAKVDVPGKVYIRGYGLESEWKGAFNITGKASEPKIDGRLTLVDGRLQFLTREFTLTEGAITLTGPYPPTPVINVVAQVKSGDVTAIVRISGPARSPQITLESTPPLPNDEILARVLFGRDMSRISPLEALQLAQAARMLAGGPRGFPVLRQIGEVIGLDRLSLLPGGNKSTETALGLGRKLGKNVRVNVQQGLTGQDGAKLDVEYELSPNLTLQGSLGQQNDQSVELNWRKEY